MSSSQPPTTRWRDPDTGQLIGSPLAELALGGPIQTKFRSPTAADEARVIAARLATEGVPVVAAPVVAPSLKTPKAKAPGLSQDAADEAEAKAQVFTLSKAVLAGDAEADVGLMRFRDAEYQRPGGGRIGVKRALAAAGYGRP